MNTVREITSWVMGLWVLVPAVLFVIHYAALVRIRTWAGWNALVLTTCIAAFMGERLFLRLFGTWAGHDVFSLLVALVAGFAIWQRLWHLWTSTLRRRQVLDHTPD